MAIKQKGNGQRSRQFLIPLFIGFGIATLLHFSVGWWGFWVIFPWIGFSISLGMYLMERLPRQKKSLGRRVAILLVMFALLFFVPIVNNENFQLEGVVLLVLVGFFGKGVIHYAIAKVFGPLVWRRGFCGWACWTAAVLEWLPVKKERLVPVHLKRIRYIALALSVALPVILVFILNFNVHEQYLFRREMVWMFVGNGLYYAIGIPLAFVLHDKRAFCKIVCPVSLVMKVPSMIGAIKMRFSGEACTECGACNRACPMDVDVMSYIARGKPVLDTECILCDECKLACPAGAIT